MPSVKNAASQAPKDSASTLTCAECRHSIAPDVRRFPASARLGAMFVCPKCAGISVVDGGKARGLRTNEWVAVILEPMGFDLIEHRVATVKEIGLA